MTGDEAQPRRHCHIIPPYVLERLAQSDDPRVAQRAREALADDRHDRGGRKLRDGGRPAPSKPQLPRGAIEVGPERLVSDAGGGTLLPGVKARGEGDPSSGDVTVDEAYDGVGATWTMFAEVFSRNSLDGKGLPLRATVHYGQDYVNAFWDGTQIVFGDGDGQVFGRFTASRDVIGHELGHGVTEHTAGLMYQGQPGAINESMSDIFGSLVRQYSAKQSTAEADWLIGADLLVGDFAGQALRSLKAPGTAYDNPVLGKDPQPDHMDRYVETDDDHGGVHINSGIPNRAFYLVAASLGGNAWDTAGPIWYATVTGDGIAADCDFATFAGLTLSTANDAYGVSSREAEAVRSAWVAVGVRPDPAKSVAEGATSIQPTSAAAGSLEVRRTGGFAGLTLERTVDLEELPREDAEQWQDLLGNRRLQSLENQPTTRADGYCYSVRCRQPETKVEIAEQNLPEPVRSLFERTLHSH